MIRKTFKGLVVLGLLFVVQTVSAEIDEYACPKVDTLQFSQASNGLFQVKGETEVLNEHTVPFELVGTTAINVGQSFFGASFGRGYLQCDYTSTAISATNKTFALKGHAEFGLEYCFFPESESKQCSGGYYTCRLLCESL